MRMKILSWLLAVSMVLSMFVSAPITAVAAELPGAVFTDGDLDRVYFTGDTLSFNLSGIPVGTPPAGIPAGTTLRVSLGIVDDSSTFTDFTLFNTLSNGMGDGTGFYAERVLQAGGNLASDISGTIVSTPTPTLGIVAVKLFVFNGSTWQNALQGQSPDYIPLTANSKPATVGLEGVMVMPDGVTCDPVLGIGAQNAEDLRSMNISFTKTIAAGITGKISFIGLNLMDNSEELAGLDGGLVMNQVAHPAEGALAQFTMGIDSTTIDYMASKGATISITSASFDGFSTDKFTAAAADAGGGSVSGLTFDDAMDTVSFNVNHFSNYTLTQTEPDYIIVIPTGDITISTDGDYQLPNGYSGIITIAATAGNVKLIGAADGLLNTGTAVSVAGTRTGALGLTIENLKIKAPDGYNGIDFYNAGNFAHKLYISGINTVTGDNGWTGAEIYHTNTFYAAGIRVPSSVQLTIDKKTGLADTQAQLTATGGNQGAGIGGGGLWTVTDTGSGTIIINGGTVTANGGPWGAGIGGGYAGTAGTTIINGGVVTANGYWATGIGGGFARSGGLTTINSGIVSAVGSYAAGIEGSKIDINGGTITAEGGRDDAANGYPGISSSDLAIDINASVKAYSQTNKGTYQAINGITSATGHNAYLLNFCLDTPVSTDTEVTITKQGIPAEAITLTIPSGFQNFATTVNGGNVYRAELTDGSKYIALVADDSRDFTSTLTPSETAIESMLVKLMYSPVCEIGTTGYANLSDALSAVTSGQTIKLLSDITYTDRIWAGSSYRPSLTLDLNGYNLEISDVEVPIAAIDGRSINVTDNSLSGGGSLILKDTLDDSAPTGIAAVGTGSSVLVDSKVTTNITATGNNSKGVSAYYGGTVELGNAIVYGDTYGAYAEGAGSSVSVTGSISAANNSNSISTYVNGSGSSVEVNGNVGGGLIGAYAKDGLIYVTGDVTNTMTNSYGAYTDNGIIIVTGNVSATGGGNYGLYALVGTVNVTGNVTSGSVGAWASSGGQITIDGEILSEYNYIQLETVGNYLSQGQYITPTNKEGYLTYTDDATPANTVWVKTDADTNCIVPDCSTSLADGGFSEYTEIGGERYYHISTAAQLAHINEHLDLNYIQTANIDLSSYNDGLWTPIGGFGDPENYSTPDYFTGKYLGAGYKIENLNIFFNNTEQNAAYAGVFAEIYGKDASVSDLTVTVAGVDITAYNYTYFGAVAGAVYGGSITDCHAVYLGDVDAAYSEGEVRHGTPNGYIGGITGYAYQQWNNEAGAYFPAAIDSCSVTFSAGSLLADGWSKWAGGIIGRGETPIMNCSVIIGEDEMIRSPNAGGIVGLMYAKTSGTAIGNCTVTGEGSIVASPQHTYSYYIGGIAGLFSEGSITDSSNEVFVNANSVTEIKVGEKVYAGGLVGYIGSRSTVTGCKNTGDVSIIIANNILDDYGVAATTTYNEFAFAGGVAGYVYGYSNAVTIENCENNANISAVNLNLGLRAYAGGIAGHVDSSDGSNAGVTVKNCANLGADKTIYTSAGTTMTGGLFGSTSFHNFATPNITLQNSYNRSSIMSESNSAPAVNGMCVGITAGGIIGAVGEIMVANTYSTAPSISAISTNGADAYEGGIFGVLYMTTTSLNYYEENTEIVRAVGAAGELLEAPDDLSGSYEGASASELKTQSFFTGWPWYSSGGTAPDYYNSANPWRITASNTYPVLKGLPYNAPTPPGGGSYTPSTYLIAATANEGGSITPAGNTTITENGNITFAIKSNKSYVVKDVLVDGTSVGAVSEYTFSSVKESHTIEAVFVHVCPSKPFTDVDITQWYHEGIDYVLLDGLFKGTSATTFEPNAAMTRAMLVTVLHRLEGTPAATTGNPFADVVSGNWYTNAVIWASAKGIVKGYDSDTFGANDFITREQLATILYRYAQYKGYDVSVGEDTNILSYVDSLNISEYAIPAVQWACGAGIMQGDGAKLDPQGNATRAQVAVMLMRFIDNVVK